MFKKVMCYLLTVVFMMSFFTIGVSAEETSTIETTFASYKMGDTQSVANDGYIGIPVKISVYYDSAKGNAVPGYNGTESILYVVGSKAERIGTKTDTEIISSMLERGYIVTVVDYLNNEKAISPDLDWSVQGIRTKLVAGDYFNSSYLPKTTSYRETFVVPAGYDVSLNNIFWELDKHGTDGSFEKIVEIWNVDFRGTKGNTVIKWVDEEGNRKETQPGYDNTQPEWLNASGVADANGEYIKVKHTKANTITDCVKKDGSPLDLNLYMHIIYPTNPANSVPVMCLANSNSHLASSAATADRPQLNGFTFNGYAGVMYDYCYTPMARDDHYGYFDGNSSTGHITGDNLTYSMQWFNNVNVDTAAMRYLRYLATDSATAGTFKFNKEAIGVYGNSKGGWMTALGEEDPTNMRNLRDFPGHHGETRYEAGKTATSGVIDGGEVQPWLSVGGETLDSGADLIYASCGGNGLYITENHAPTYISCNTGDGTGFGTSNDFVNLCRTHDVPAMWFETNVGHTFTYGEDNYHNVETYNAFFDFAGYYLKGDAVEVVYTTPKANTVGADFKDGIKIKFTGAVPAEEIQKVTVKDSASNAIVGTWSSLFGNTEWKFTPAKNAKSADSYTVTIPAGLKGDNNKGLAEDYIYTFYTAENETEYNLTLNGENYAVPSALASEKDVFLRFTVTNDAANTARISDQLGNVIADVKLKGAGEYKVDLSEVDLSSVESLKITAVKTPGTSVIFSSANATDKASKCTYASVETGKTAPDGTPAYKSYVTTNIKADGTPQYVNCVFYSNATDIYANTGLGNISDVDYGRKITVNFKVYDTVSRNIQARLSTCTSSSKKVADYDRVIKNVKTKANNWTPVSLDYTVYDSDYGVKESHAKNLNVMGEGTGDLHIPLYFADLSITETITDIEIGDVSLVALSSDNVLDKEPISSYPFAIYSNGTLSGEYSTWSEVLRAYSSGQVIKMQSNYSVTDADKWSSFAKHTSITINLNGYKLISDNTTYSIFDCVAPEEDDSIDTSITVKNGYIYLKDTPLISFKNSENKKYTKDIDFNFEDVSFKLKEESAITSFFTDGEIPVGAEIKSDIVYDGCEFAFDSSLLSADKMTIFEDGDKGLDLNYVVKGGTFNLSDSASFTIGSSVYNVEFAKDAEEKYSRLILPGSETVTSEVVRLAEGYATFGNAVADGPYMSYTPVVNTLATPYGAVSASYSSAEDYPLALFNNGKFVGAYSDFGTDGAGAFASIRGAGAGSILYLRRDFTHTTNSSYINNFSFLPDGVTIDLGGHTLTYEQTMLQAYGRHATTTSITVMNGTFVSGGKNPVANIHYGTNADKVFNFTFKDLTFKLGSASTQTTLINYASSNVKGTANILIDNCVFDFTEKTPASAYVLFGAGGTTNYATTNLTVNGGKVIAPSLNNITLYKDYGNSACKTLFKNETEGSALHLEVPSSLDVSLLRLPLSSGDGYFQRVSDDGTTAVYSLTKPGSLVTPYGTIGDKYISAEDYPIVLFKDGTFKGAFSSFGTDGAGAFASARSAGAGAVLYLRRNYTHTTSSSYINNFSFLPDGLTIDLGGNKLTYIQTMLQAYGRHTTTTSVTVMNGTFVSGGSNPFANVHFGTNDGKVFNFTFKNLTFKLGSESTQTALLKYNSSSKTGTANILIEDCEFDLASNAPSAQYTLFSAGGTNNYATTKLTVKGCNIKANDLSNITLYSTHNNPTCSVIFDKNGSGEMLSLVVPSSVDVSSKTLPTQSGNANFAKEKEEGTTVVYSLVAPSDLVTEYGTIPGKYASKLDYPFVVFKANGTFVGAYSDYGSDGAGPLYGVRTGGTDSVIYVRRDYTYESTGSNHNNSTFWPTNFIIDLGGNKFSYNKVMFNHYVRTTSSTSPESNGVTVKNGTLEALGSNGLASFNYFNASKPQSLTFNDVTFTFAANTQTSLLKYTTAKVEGKITAEFNDCIFDFTKNAPSSYVLFSAGGTKDLMSTDITVNGGEILANSLSGITLYSTNGIAESSVIFGDNEEDEKIKISLPTGIAVTDEKFVTDDGIMCFVTDTEDAEKAIYKLSKPGVIATINDNEVVLDGFFLSDFVGEKYLVVIAKYSADGKKLEDVAVSTPGVVGAGRNAVSMSGEMSASKENLKVFIWTCDELTPIVLNTDITFK